MLICKLIRVCVDGLLRYVYQSNTEYEKAVTQITSYLNSNQSVSPNSHRFVFVLPPLNFDNLASFLNIAFQFMYNNPHSLRTTSLTMLFIIFVGSSFWKFLAINAFYTTCVSIL